MSLARGKFGVEYNPKRIQPKSSGFGWLYAVIALAALVSFTWTMVRRWRDVSEDAAQQELIRVERGLTADYGVTPSSTESTAATSQAFTALQPLKSSLAERPPQVRNLLMRLEEAERKRNVVLAISTIETIRNLPGSPAADLDDSLARRLGVMNMRWLFDLHNAQWVKAVTVGRGDNASRIAAENGSTLLSCARLNGGRDKIERIVIGQKLYVMNHPRFNLVIHRRARMADLLLNGRFFKRYDTRADFSANVGAYELSDRRRSFWESLGSPFSAANREELDLLMPNGSSILISEL